MPDTKTKKADAPAAEAPGAPLDIHARIYLGDGLYCGYDGHHFGLMAQRQNGMHFVLLNPTVLDAFMTHVARVMATHEGRKH